MKKKTLLLLGAAALVYWLYTKQHPSSATLPAPGSASPGPTGSVPLAAPV